jgi:hypothetical protein
MLASENRVFWFPSADLRARKNCRCGSVGAYHSRTRGAPSWKAETVSSGHEDTGQKCAPSWGGRATCCSVVWVRRSAIRPVPSYAAVSAQALEAVRDELADDDEEARAQLDDAFERFERAQPSLAAYVAETLGRPLDETALALGYFLALTVWLAFDRAHRSHMDEVTEEELVATEELLTLDEELRRADPAESLDSDDVIAMEQPHVVAFVHEHIDGTLDAHAEEIDVDDVHAVYRVVLVEILALSYAVQRPEGFPVSKTELLA